MSTGSVRSCPSAGASGVFTSVTSRLFSASTSPSRMIPADAALRPAPVLRDHARARGRVPARSDVQEPDVLGVALDKRPPRLHVLAHQHAEELIRLRGVVQRDLPEHPPGGVHVLFHHSVPFLSPRPLNRCTPSRGLGSLRPATMPASITASRSGSEYA